MCEYRQKERTIVSAFDFDGTLTTADTFMAFIRFTHGRCRMLQGFLRHVHWLFLMRLGLCPSWKVKEKIFGYFYKGTTYGQFTKWGHGFSDRVEMMLNSQTVEALRQHQTKGHTVCVVTASIDEWVRPVCERLGIHTVLATQIEVSADGKLTGRFLSPNCNGAQKVSRLSEVFPERQTFRLYAYGDSRGDDELLKYADEPFLVEHRSRSMICQHFLGKK